MSAWTEEGEWRCMLDVMSDTALQCESIQKFGLGHGLPRRFASRNDGDGTLIAWQ